MDQDFRELHRSIQAALWVGFVALVVTAALGTLPTWATWVAVALDAITVGILLAASRSAVRVVKRLHESR